MGEAADVVLDPRFVEWYKTVDLGDDTDRVERRWAGISAAYNLVNNENVAILCQLAFGGACPAAANLAWFEAALKSADDEFSIGTNEKELRILAGACIVNELEWASSNQSEICVRISLAAFSGLRAFSLPLDIGGLIRHTIRRMAIEGHARPDLDELKVPAINAATLASQWGNPAAAAKLLVEAINTPFGVVSRMMHRVDRVLRAQDDELQILWWLYGGRSVELEIPFSKVPNDIRPLRLAKELADFTNVLPGPASILEILSKAGVQTTGKISVLNSVGAVQIAWATELISAVQPSLWIHPLHYALSLRVQSGDKWQAYWASVVRIDEAATLSPMQLAAQFYHERLLLKRIGESE